MTGLQSGAAATGGWVRLPAVLEQVEQTVTVLHGYLNRQPVCVSDFEFDLLCFEALSNAVRHGCASDPARRVTADLEVTGDAVILTITDDGPGFDWRAGTAATPSDDATGGRGLWILRRYADEVRFNDAGNQITIVKHGERRGGPADYTARTGRPEREERGPA